jgi:putative tryptophan/tyrosine transport system substrate-binding protein
MASRKQTPRDLAERVGASRQGDSMTEIRCQRSEVSGQKASRGLALSSLPFALSLVSVLLLALCSSAEAQQSGKVPRVGYVTSTGTPSNPGPSGQAFRQGLRDLGYVEGQNILVEYRYIEGNPDRIPGFIAELFELKVDVLVATSPTAIRAAKQTTKTVPIVMVTTQDPVVTGIVNSLARPGGNVTGLTQLTRELSGKRLELLKEVIPTVSRIGVLTVEGPGALGSALKEYEAAAQALEIPILSLRVRRSNPDIEGAFRRAIKGRVGALIIARNQVLTPHTKKIGDLALKNRLPSMHEVMHYVEAGGLMSYGASDVDLFRRAAAYVDKILKGTKPADLPVEQPTKFEFVINLKIAKALNLTIPQSVLFRADRVIK